MQHWSVRSHTRVWAQSLRAKKNQRSETKVPTDFFFVFFPRRIDMQFPELCQLRWFALLTFLLDSLHTKNEATYGPGVTWGSRAAFLPFGLSFNFVCISRSHCQVYLTAAAHRRTRKLSGASATGAKLSAKQASLSFARAFAYYARGVAIAAVTARLHVLAALGLCI